MLNRYICSASAMEMRRILMIPARTDACSRADSKFWPDTYDADWGDEDCSGLSHQLRRLAHQG